MSNKYKSYNININEKLLDKIINMIIKNIETDKVILFGSRARQDNKYNSDVDIAIKTNEDLAKIKFLIEEDLQTLLKFNIVNYNKINDKLKKEIDREGVVIYEKITTNNR